jgi:hypothetical protein
MWFRMGMLCISDLMYNKEKSVCFSNRMISHIEARIDGGE